MPEKPVNLCDKHAVPYAYSSEECPMCRFLREVINEKEKSYKQGFVDGIEAQKKEQELQAKAVEEKKKK